MKSQGNAAEKKERKITQLHEENGDEEKRKMEEGENTSMNDTKKMKIPRCANVKKTKLLKGGKSRDKREDET